MQTQTQLAAHSRAIPESRGELMLAAGTYIGLHLMWFILPLLIEGDEVPAAAKVVTGVTLGLGLIAIWVLSSGRRWGWWLLTVLTVLNVVFTIPEVVALEGVLRVGSIVSLVLLGVLLVLLSRPALRQARG